MIYGTDMQYMVDKIIYFNLKITYLIYGRDKNFKFNCI